MSKEKDRKGEKRNRKRARDERKKKSESESERKRETADIKGIERSNQKKSVREGGTDIAGDTE
eukprot:141326-Amorphochlora_amoeboformis.AAC.1